jgi:isopenicillin-N epimerase
VDAEPGQLAFVPNATYAVNSVLRSLDLGPGDELLTTDHAYNACRNALGFVAERTGASLVVARVPFPLRSAREVTGAVLDRVTGRTRLALIDHITSQTGLVFPVGEIVRELSARGVDTLVDGAHAPGMVDLSCRRTGAAYLTGNFHKWVCAPKGAAFLHVRSDLLHSVRPLAISHGANAPVPGRSRFHLEFDYTGTDDPTPFLCVPAAIRFMGSLLEGGWPALRRANREKVLAGRRLLCDALGLRPPCPDDMVGSLAALPLPDGSADPPRSPLYLDPLQDRLLDQYGLEVPVIPWPAPPGRLIRISAQAYNRVEDYQKLAAALLDLLP